jgi:glucokinase
MINILVADIGGTHIRFNFFEYNEREKSRVLIKNLKVRSKDFKSIPEVLKFFISSLPSNSTKNIHACLAIAGPENDNFIKPSNLDWEGVSTEQLINQFEFKSAYLINDFVAIGNGCNFFSKNELEEINPKGIKEEEGNLLIIGVSTGIGVCYVTRYLNNKKEIQEVVNPSEFGHGSLCVKNYFDFVYQQFVRFFKSVKEEQLLSLEVLTSATGLRILYNFITFIHKTKLGRKKFENLMNGDFDVDYDESQGFNFGEFKLEEITAEEILTRFEKGEEVARFALAYIMELIGNAIYIFSAAFLPTRGTIIIGSFISCLNVSLKKIGKQSFFFDILMKNIMLEGHLKERFGNMSYSIFLGGSDKIGLDGALSYLLKKEKLE